MRIKNTPFAGLAFALPALALAAPAAALAPVSVAPAFAPIGISAHADPIAEESRDRSDRYRDYGRGYDRYERDDRDRRYRGRNYDRNYGEPVYRNTRIWRGRNGQYHCQKENGTTGLLIGAAVGGLVGNEVAGRGDRTLGAIIGAAGGAILGRTIDRSNSRCR